MNGIEKFLKEISSPENIDEFLHDPDEAFGEYEAAEIFPRKLFCWEMIGVTEYMMDYLDTFFGALITEDLADVETIEDWCQTIAGLVDQVGFISDIRAVLEEKRYDILTASRVRPHLVGKYPVLVGEDAEGFWQTLVYLARPITE